MVVSTNQGEPISPQLLRELRVQLYPAVLAFFRQRSMWKLVEMSIASDVRNDGKYCLRIDVQVVKDREEANGVSLVSLNLAVSEVSCSEH